MSKRLQHPKGPANMASAFSLAVLEEDKPKLKSFQGFTGFPGWRYHPTRGFKKMQGFVATTKQEVVKCYATTKPEAIEGELVDSVDLELSQLL